MLICFNIFRRTEIIFFRRTKVRKVTPSFCQFCKKAMLPKIWIEHKQKLSNEQNIEHLMENWDSLGLPWNENDALGCRFVPTFC